MCLLSIISDEILIDSNKDYMKLHPLIGFNRLVIAICH